MSRITGLNSNDVLEEDSDDDEESKKLSTPAKDGEDQDADLERDENMSPDEINSPLQSNLQSPDQSPLMK
jgi:hypothetical protein